MSVIRKNLLYQVLAQAGGKGLMFVIYVLLARLLGPGGTGVFDYALSTVQIVGGIFFELGLLLVVTRELAKGNAAVFRPALWLKALGCLLGCLVLIGVSVLMQLPPLLVFLLVAYTVFNSYTNLYICIFRARNRMDAEALVTILQRFMALAILVLCWLALRRGAELINAAGLSFALAGLLGLICAIWLTRRNFSEVIAGSAATELRSQIVELAREALPLIGVSIAWLIYYKIDVVMLGSLSTKVQVGFYSTCVRLNEAALLVPLVVTNAVFARLTAQWEEDRQLFKSNLCKVTLALSGLGLTAAIAIAFLADFVVVLLYGASFLPAGRVLSLLVLALAVVYPGWMLTQTLVILGRQTLYLWLSIGAAALNIGLNFFLIPLMQARGAAIATIATEALVTCTALVVVLRDVHGTAQHANRN